MNNVILNTLKLHQNSIAMVWGQNQYTYKDLITNIGEKIKLIEQYQDKKMIAIIDDYSINSVSCLIAALHLKKIVIPLSRNFDSEIFSKKFDLIFCDNNFLTNSSTSFAEHELIKKLIQQNHAGLIYLTSGTGGEPKIVLHDFDLFFDVMIKPKSASISILYLKFDHFGGLNSLLPFLLNGSTLIIPENKSPEHILNLVQKYKITLLPVTPTFLSMTIAMNLLDKFDLSSIKTISYGAEPCDNEILTAWQNKLPKVKFHQTYGLTETGTLKSKNKNGDYLYLTFTDSDLKYRIVEGKLEIKPRYLMMGYLNAESPFTDDLFLKTNDFAEVTSDGFVKIIGRQSEIIYISGEKINPHEVEKVLIKYPGVFSAKVFGKKDLLFGTILAADLFVDAKLICLDDIQKIKTFCLNFLPLLKVPADINFYDPISSNEVKKIRFYK